MTKAEADADGVTLTIEAVAGGEAQEMRVDVVLVSIGRRPFTDDLGLDSVGIVPNERGFIAVDEHYRTTAAGIFAIGDVIGGQMLAHKAEEEGVACVERIAGQAGHVNYEAIPGVVYTWPEVAAVGRTEEKLKADGVEYKVGKFPFTANSRARCNGDMDGFVKILADAKTDRILGVHIIGPEAGDLIQEIVTAMEFGASAEDIAHTCARPSDAGGGDQGSRPGRRRPAAEHLGEALSPAARLRALLQRGDLLVMPCCFDALSARLIEDAGFPLTFMSGFAVSATRLGLPDTGLISYGEMLDQGRNICGAVRIPVLGDGDTGHGNAMNVRRTVEGFAAAGFAAVMIEDQVAPKRCGHTRGKAVVDREEALVRIRAAVDAREAGADILILARTDARATHGLDEAIARAQAFAGQGADILFVEAPADEAEMAAICRQAPGRHMANMLEGGVTPWLAARPVAGTGLRHRRLSADPAQRRGPGDAGEPGGDGRRPASG